MVDLPSHLQALLHPVIRSLSLLDSAIHSDKKGHVQPSAALVISAVRSVLLQTDCLNKDSKTLARYPTMSKERKGILVELNRLVQAAKQASGMMPGGEERTLAEETKDWDSLAKSARLVFAGMKRFLQYANDYTVDLIPLDGDAEATVMGARMSGTQTPVYTTQRTSETFDAEAMRGHRTRLSSNGTIGTPGNSRIQDTFKMRAASVGDLRAARRRASSPPPPMPNTAGIITNRISQNLSNREAGTRSSSDASTPLSATFNSSSSGRSSPVSVRSGQQHRFGGSIDSTSTNPNSPVVETHPQFLDDNMATPAPPRSTTNSLSSSVDVLEAISVAEDSLLSIIAAFIGHIHSHHMGSHPSSHANLIEMTRETIDAVRSLLTVVEAVGRDNGIRQSRPREIEHLRVTKDTLYDVASRLVEGVEIIGNAAFIDTTEEDYETVKHQLLSTATATLRAGTECVRLVRICVPEGSDSFSTTPTPAYTETLARQSTPRPPPKDAAVILRDRIVGQRGTHTLSALHRKASSLSLLHQRFRDGTSMSSTAESSEATDEEDEEIVADASRDDDMTLQPGLPLARPFPGHGVSKVLHLVELEAHDAVATADDPHAYLSNYWAYRTQISRTSAFVF